MIDDAPNVLLRNESGPISSVVKSPHMGNAKQNLISRINRIEGQVRGVQRLILKDASYIEVITQISAIQAALTSIVVIQLEKEIKKSLFDNGEINYELINQVLRIIQKRMK